MISLGQIAVFKPAVLTWLPVMNGQAATLLVPGALKVNGSMRPVIASITPSAEFDYKNNASAFLARLAAISTPIASSPCWLATASTVPIPQNGSMMQ